MVEDGGEIYICWLGLEINLKMDTVRMVIFKNKLMKIYKTIYICL